MSRSTRRLVAEETLGIIESGFYVNRQGDRVSVVDEMKQAIAGTELIRPDDIMSMTPRSDIVYTNIEVFNETTFAGAKDLLDAGVTEVCSLNFASAKNPGGGFLGGSQAQEEALARASGLYPCLQTAMPYYEFHRSGGTCLYSHHMIYSPGVPVFRDDADQMLGKVWQTAIITSPAVNAGALHANNPELVGQIESVMAERIERVLLLAASRGHRNLVLGAWGCGVFRNDPEVMAQLFADGLNSKPFKTAFDNVRFSVLDRTGDSETFTAFKDRLGK